MKKTTTTPAVSAGNAVSTALQYECEVLTEGAARKYGSCNHKRGKGARVFLDEAEKDAAEKAGWVKVVGIKSTAAPAAATETVTTD